MIEDDSWAGAQETIEGQGGIKGAPVYTAWAPALEPSLQSRTTFLVLPSQQQALPSTTLPWQPRNHRQSKSINYELQLVPSNYPSTSQNPYLGFFKVQVFANGGEQSAETFEGLLIMVFQEFNHTVMHNGFC